MIKKCLLDYDNLEEKYKISNDKREKSEKLKDENLVLVCNYPWDGNSYPGNEYWCGGSYLSGSSDPAAACR